MFFPLRLVPPSCPIYFPSPRQKEITPTYLCPCSARTSFRLGGGWNGVYSHCLRGHPHFLPAVRSLCLSPDSSVLGPSVSLLCHPNCATADLATCILKVPHLLISSYSCCSSRPPSLTCSSQRSGCSPLVSNLGGMCGRGSSRWCRSLWSRTLFTLTCRLLPLGT